MALKTTNCPKCDGTGKVLDRVAVGSEMRSERERAGVSLRRVARVSGKSVAYLSELELGRQPWSVGLVSAYQRAIEAAKEAS